MQIGFLGAEERALRRGYIRDWLGRIKREATIQPGTLRIITIVGRRALPHGGLRGELPRRPEEDSESSGGGGSRNSSAEWEKGECHLRAGAKPNTAPLPTPTPRLTTGFSSIAALRPGH